MFRLPIASDGPTFLQGSGCRIVREVDGWEGGQTWRGGWCPSLWLEVPHGWFSFLHQAVAKIREFILQKVYSFRKPMTNYQIPQNALLKYR